MRGSRTNGVRFVSVEKNTRFPFKTDGRTQNMRLVENAESKTAEHDSTTGSEASTSTGSTSPVSGHMSEVRCQDGSNQSGAVGAEHFDQQDRVQNCGQAGGGLQEYVMLEELGRGGMGVVYKARHSALNKTMAAKILHRELAESAVNVKRFHQEAQAASLLNHPNLVSVYDSGISRDGKPYLIMDYLDGCGLDEKIQQQGFLDLDLFFHIFAQVCDGLAHAHERGVIHRDLKPANIMVMQTAHDHDFVKIVDFGIARLLQQATKDGVRVTQTGDVIGSPVYMSPEQCLGHPMDERSDIYSLGVVMYEALTGTVPFLGENAIQVIVKQIQEAPLSPRRLRPDLNIPEQLDDLILKALAKQPEERWQSVGQLTAELEAIFNGKESPRSGLTIKDILTGRRPTWYCQSLQKTLPAMAALVVIAIIALGYSILHPRPTSPITASPPAVRSRVAGVLVPGPAVVSGDKHALVQQHLAKAHQQLAALRIDAATAEFKRAYHIVSDGEENQYPAAELCVAMADAIVASIPQSDWQAPDHDRIDTFQEQADKAAYDFYAIAQQYHQKQVSWPHEEIPILQKMERVYAPLKMWKRHLTLLKENHYPTAQIVMTSYDGGVRALSEGKDGRIEAEKFWLQGLPYNIKAKGPENCFPGPIEALADLYHNQHRYAKEAELRKISVAHLDEACAGPDGSYLYGHAARGYRHWIYSLDKLGRKDELSAVIQRFGKLKQRAAKEGWKDDSDTNIPPHLPL